MGLVFLIVIGAILGWLAAIVFQANNTRDLQINVAVGMSGALLAGVLTDRVVGGGNLLSGSYAVPALLMSVLGAIVLLLLVNAMRPYREGAAHRPDDRLS